MQHCLSEDLSAEGRDASLELTHHEVNLALVLMLLQLLLQSCCTLEVLLPLMLAHPRLLLRQTRRWWRHFAPHWGKRDQTPKAARQEETRLGISRCFVVWHLVFQCTRELVLQSDGLISHHSLVMGLARVQIRLGRIHDCSLVTRSISLQKLGSHRAVSFAQPRLHHIPSFF